MPLAHGQKRSRSDKENESTSHHHRFHFVGSETPSDDRGSRALQLSRPDWQQDALDERGRKRFHGAFTGGFSAGYFNTVGSKEGFVPTSFVSSRANRAAPAHDLNDQKRREAYMDDEDLVDAAATRTVQAVDTSTLSTIAAQESSSHDIFKAVFRSHVDTAAIRAMQSMGWRPSKPRAEAWSVANEPSRHGAGYRAREDVAGAAKAESKSSFASPTLAQTMSSQNHGRRTALKPPHAADDSSDESLSDMGPKIAVHRKGQSLKKTKKAIKPLSGVTSANPLLASRPVFRAKSSLLSDQSVAKCHDGRLARAGFELLVGRLQDQFKFLLAAVGSNGRFDPPALDPAWEASTTIRKPSNHTEPTDASTTSPETRATLMGWGEAKKSVFDFVSSGARDRIAAAVGRADLPRGRGQDLAFQSQANSTPKSSTLLQLRLIPKETAAAVRDRAKTGWILYKDDNDKQSRFITFLDFCSQARDDLPGSQNRLSGPQEAFVQELSEFASAATMFKPMTGVMASRFTTAVSAQHQPNQEPKMAEGDPAQDAAKAGMYGSLTRRVFGFYPVSLVCKRFDVIQPAVPADCERGDLHDAPELAADGVGLAQRGAVYESQNASIEGPRAVENIFEEVFGDGS